MGILSEENELTGLAGFFLALSDKTRLRLIRLMADGPRSVGYLAESVAESQPKVSRHLAYLRSAKLVSTTRSGKNIFYGIQWPGEEIANAVIAAVIGTEDMAPDETSNDTYVEAYINRREPEEMEIHLL